MVHSLSSVTLPFRLAGLALSLAVAACGPGGGGANETQPDQLAGNTGFRSQALSEPLEKVDFLLTSTDGRPFQFRLETDGFLTLLFFGYTHCPDVCPIHMATLAAVLADLESVDRARVKVVFVTTDPDRDTPERLRNWLDGFDSRFVGLWGSAAEVDEIQRALGLGPAILEEPDEDGNYGVGHAAHVLAFESDGFARHIYPFGTRQSDWAHDLPLLLGR